MRLWIGRVTSAPYKWFESFVHPGENLGIRGLFRLFAFALIVMVILLIVDVVITVRSYSSESPWHGTFGDFFGGVVNPFLTFLTFMGLLLTIVVQKVELRDSREELAKSAVALAEQSQHFKFQNASATFYKMLDIHVATLGSIDLVDDNNRVTRGRDCVRIFYRRLITEFRDNCLPAHSNYVQGRLLDTRRPSDDPKTLVVAFKKFWSDEQEELQQYMAGVFIAFSYIESELGSSSLYLDIYKSMFSDLERILIFYYAMVKGTDEMRRLLSKFAFCAGLPPDRLLDGRHALSLSTLSL